MLDVTEAVSAAVARSLPLDNLQAARRSVQQWAAGTQRAAARVDLAATLERLAAQAATARASETAAEDLAAELDELYPAGGFDYERYSGCWSDPPVAVIAGSQASQAMQRSLHESCSRPMLQAMAQVLSQAGSALQDASRQLTQLAGDEPVEIARHRSANDTPR